MRCGRMKKLVVNKVAPGVWKVEEYNEDFNKEVQVWIDLKGIHCNCSSRAFKGHKCKHIVEVERYEQRASKTA